MMFGVFVRTVLVWHITWAVNSATHLWGYRNYETDEDSRNNLVVGLISNGEGWHNNHHADPRSARHGHRWWEIDNTWLTIRLLAWLGLATDVVTPNAQLAGRPIGKQADDTRNDGRSGRVKGYASVRRGNSTIASPVATFSPFWFFTMTSIRTQRDFAVACFDLTMPVGWMVSPGRTGLTHRVSRRRWIAPARIGPVGDHARDQPEIVHAVHDDAAEIGLAEIALHVVVVEMQRVVVERSVAKQPDGFAADRECRPLDGVAGAQGFRTSWS